MSDPATQLELITLDMLNELHKCANCNLTIFDYREHCPECGMPGMLPVSNLSILVRGVIEAPEKEKVVTFAAIPIGGQFVEVFTTCDEVAVRIAPTTHRGKTVNARRVGGKLIFMADWEPVFIKGEK